MFEDLFDFSKKRTNKEAVGFYLVYLGFLFVIIAIVKMLATIIAAGDSVSADAFTEQITHSLIFPLYCVVLSVIVVRKRDLRSFGFVALVLLAGVASFLSGALGVMVPAFLTTREEWEED